MSVASHSFQHNAACRNRGCAPETALSAPDGAHAGINIDPSTASKADGQKLGSIMMYNMISGAGTDAHQEGTPESLAAKQDVQTLLGAANSQQLPLHFTRKGDQVRQ
jgi:hypothetical protein